MFNHFFGHDLQFQKNHKTFNFVLFEFQTKITISFEF
jgi:hypothetical protein